MPAVAALEACLYALDLGVTGAASAGDNGDNSSQSLQCLTALKPRVKPSSPKSLAADVVSFCTSQTTSTPLQCVQSGEGWAVPKGHTPLDLPQLLLLCAGAEHVQGPMQCVDKIRGGPASASSSKLAAVELLRLCSSASGQGPAVCFASPAPASMTAEVKIELCQVRTRLPLVLDT